MNLRQPKVIALIATFFVAITLPFFTHLIPTNSPGKQMQDYSVKRTQYALRAFAINRWNVDFNGTFAADVKTGPFINYSGDNVLAQIIATNFNRATSGRRDEVGWREEVASLFGEFKSEDNKTLACEMFFNAVLYPESTLGDYVKNYRTNLKNLGLIPFSFDEISMLSYSPDTIQYPTGNQVSPLIKCGATAVFIQARGGYTPPYKTTMVWEYAVDAGLVMPRITFNILAS